MFLKHLTIAYRNLWNNKFHTCLNILGLTIGFSTLLIIALNVMHAYSFDHFHKNAERIVKVEAYTTIDNSTYRINGLSYRFGEMAQKKLAGIENHVALRQEPMKFIRIDRKSKPFESYVAFTDEHFFQVFSFPLLRGDAKSALSKPFTAVVTQVFAEQNFGHTNPIGQKIIYENQYPLKIVGVMKTPPLNSNFGAFEIMINSETFWTINRKPRTGSIDSKTFEKEKNEVSINGDFETYLLLKHPKFKGPILRYLPSILDSPSFATKHWFSISPLTDLFLSTNPAVQKNINSFAGMGLLILLLALINYINLSTARATSRSREVAIRKVMGGHRTTIIAQFFTESTLCVSIAFLIAILIFSEFKTLLDQEIGVRIAPDFYKTSYFWLPIFSIFVLCMLISGAYPALLLSRFSPIIAMNKTLNWKKTGLSVRQFLTVFQFTAAIILLCSSIVIHQQLFKMLNPESGFNRERVVGWYLGQETEIGKIYKPIKQKLEQLTELESINELSGAAFYTGIQAQMMNLEGNSNKKMVQFYHVDPSFIKNMQIKWSYQPDKDSEWDTNGNIVLNRKAAKALGIQPNAIHRNLVIGTNIRKKVVGIVEDFHFESMRGEIQPLAFSIDKKRKNYDHFYLRLSPSADKRVVLRKLEKIYRQYEPHKPFVTYLVTEAHDAMYNDEIGARRLTTGLTLLAFLIACLGLLGLSTFSTEQRIKEIGIRKISGASVLSIARMLTKDFLKLVLIAIIVAMPIAIYLCNWWLKDFAYRIELHWWMFAAAGLGALLIALFTVSFQGIKVALANPVKSLKSE
jgi:putative ABC transport system permease protein